MSVRDTGRDRRSVAGRRFGKIVVTLAVAATAAAIGAPGASASVPADGGTPCVYKTFQTSNTYSACVGALQVLLNDMRNAALGGPDRILKTDGIYGSNTYSDVKATNTFCYQHDWGLCKGGSGYTTPATWKYVCGSMYAKGLYRGSTYYYVANCDVLYRPAGSPPPAPNPPSQKIGPTSPGPTPPQQHFGPVCPRTGAVPQPPGSGPAPGSGPRPGRLIEHASWSFQRTGLANPRCGWTLHVTPTRLARAAALNPFTNPVAALQGWNELYRDYRNVAHGIKHNLKGMKFQYECHAQVVAIRKPHKPTWNLDEWRPAVSYPATLKAQCNP